MRFLFLVSTLALTLASCSESPDAEAPAASTSVPEVSDAPVAVAAPRINLNTASEADFKTIPGVGDKMAHEFDEYRPYASIEQFRREIGKYVDDEQVAAYEPYVFVPVDVDQSDAATLQQLPGVGQAEAEALIAGRPYGSHEAFLTAYEAAVPGGDRAAAALTLVAE